MIPPIDLAALNAVEIDGHARRAKAGGYERVLLPALTREAERRRSDPLLWQWKGLLHMELAEMAAAIQAFRRAVHLAPDDGRIAHALARSTFSAGLPAVDLFYKASQLSPGDGNILLGLAAALCAEGRRVDAIAGLAGMLAVNPAWIAGHDALCRLRWEQGDRRGFADSLEAALDKMPASPALWRSLILLLVHARAWERVLAAIARGRATVGDMPFLVANEAVTLSETGDFNGADPLFVQLESEQDPLLVVHRLRHELHAGRPDRAAAIGEQWTSHDAADFIWPYLSLAWRLTGDPRRNWLEREFSLARVIDLPFNKPELGRLAVALRGLHQAQSEGLDQSVRGGTQTDGHLLNRIEPEIQHLRSLIVKAVAEYVVALPSRDDTHPFLRHRRDREARLAGSWSVRLQGQGHHANHIHPAGWISSAFYVALPKTATDNAHAGWLALGNPPDELKLDLSAERRIEPETGRLVLFPSIMWHGTVPFRSGERLTVAFDISRPKGHISA